MRLLLLLCLLLCAGAAAAADREVALTWEAARVALPAEITGRSPLYGSWRSARVQQSLARAPAGVRVPAVIFMHGCTGYEDEGDAYRYDLPLYGFAFFAPDSFARIDRRPNCDPERHTTQSFQRAETFRLEEIEYAVEQVLALPWIDPSRLYLLGFSEGGVAAARYADNAFAGIVITAWHCHGKGANRGIAAPPQVPVLAILGEDDPWYIAKNGAHCGPFLEGRQGSRSLVLPDHRHSIATSHSVDNTDLAKAEILRFLGVDLTTDAQEHLPQAARFLIDEDAGYNGLRFQLGR